MMSKNKIINTLEHCINDRCDQCPIGYKDGRLTCPQFENCYHEVPEAVLLDALKMLKQQQWVSVNDRLPEENVPVLVWELQGFAYVDVYKDGAWEVGTPNLAKFTHWMPLPEPPKEVSE